MNSVVEKITLYDFFGYLVPGTVFEMLLGIICLLRLDSEAMAEVVAKVSDLGGGIYLGFFLGGYVMGLLLSEAAAGFYGIKWVRDRLRQSVAEKATLSEDVIRNALARSGLVERDIMDTMGMKELLEKYSQMMFVDIQTDAKYKRIHDYASFATMCKNLSAAFAVAVLLVPVLMGGCGWQRMMAMAVIYLIAMAVFAGRYQRFYLKRQIYTIQWFVEKNRNRTVKKDRKKG